VTRPTARVLALLELLQAGGWRTVPALAERLGVDERTVRRYATHLADLGIPVEARRGRYGGYRLAPGFKLPPLMFTDDEAVAAVLGLLAARRAGLVTAEAAATESALAKVRRVLPRELTGRLDALLSTVDITAPGRVTRAAAPPEAEVLLALADATRRRVAARISYVSWRGRESQRRLDPYGLVCHAGRWYVTGHDHDSGAVRTFRLDRVASVALLPEEGFDVPAGFDPAARVLAGLATVPYAHEVVVVLHTTVEEARRRIPPAVGVLAATEAGVRLTARAERLDGAAQLLAGLGWDFTVERPPELRDAVRDLAARLAASAGR
jgi:predicted DNA-binding transcriptional regulator YafY